MVPTSALQVDIYITNFKPILVKSPARLPLQTPTRARSPSDPSIRKEELQPPHRRFAGARSRSNTADSVESQDTYSSDVDLSYYSGENADNEPPVEDMNAAHQTNILELTNFDGDVDTALPGEASLSLKVKKEGKIRRLQSRKLGKAVEARRDHDARTAHLPSFSQVQSLALAPPLPANPPPVVSRPRRAYTLSVTSAQSTERLLPISPLSELATLATSGADEYTVLSLFSPYADSPPASVPPIIDLAPTVSIVAPSVTRSRSGSSPRPSWSYSDAKSEVDGSRTLATSRPLSIMTATTATMHDVPPASARANPQIRFEIDDQEATDVNVVSEKARPGKPKLDKVIADEVEGSKGAVVVACEFVFSSGLGV
jgi:hypothetical protein